MHVSMILNYRVSDDQKSESIEFRKLRGFIKMYIDHRPENVELILFATNCKKDSIPHEFLTNISKKVYEYKDGAKLVQNENKFNEGFITSLYSEVPLSWAQTSNICMQDQELATGKYFVRCHYDIETDLSIIHTMIFHFEKNPIMRKYRLGALSGCTRDDDIRVEPSQSVSMIQGKFEGSPIEFAKQINNTHRGYIKINGLQQHMFVMIPRSVYEDVGIFNEGFQDAFGEDLEWSYRAYQKGYVLATALDCYVHHVPDSNEENFSKKVMIKTRNDSRLANYQHNEIYDTKFIAMMNIDSEPALSTFDRKYHSEKIMFNIRKFIDAGVDKIVLMNRGDLPAYLDVEYLKKNEKSLDWVMSKMDSFDDKRDMDNLIQYTKKKYNPKWMIFIDTDELLPYEFDRDLLNKIYNCPHLRIFGLQLPMFYHWMSEEYYRGDGSWGADYSNVRIWRNFPFFMETYKKTNLDPVTQKSPQFPDDTLMQFNCRLRTFGYMTKEQRQARHDFYCKHDKTEIVDTDPPSNDFDKSIDSYRSKYHYILDESYLNLIPYQKDASITSVTMAHSIEDTAEEYLIIKSHSSLWAMCKYLVFYDNGCTDKTIENIKPYGAQIIKGKPEWFFPKGHKFEGWINNHSVVGNYCFKVSKTPWIFRTSADEMLMKESAWRIIQFTNYPVDYIRPYINNPLRKGGSSDQHRINLFRNDPKRLYVTRCIHENHQEAMERFGSELVGQTPNHHESIFMLHLGYMKPDDKHQEKKYKEYYHFMNTKAMNANKKDGWPPYNLGVEKVLEGDMKSARGYFKQAIKRNNSIAMPHYQLFMIGLKEIREYAEDYIKKSPNGDQNKAALQQYLKVTDRMNIENVLHFGDEFEIPADKIVRIR